MEHRRPGRRPHPNPPTRRYRTLSLATADDEEVHERGHSVAQKEGFTSISQLYLSLLRKHLQEKGEQE